MDEDNTLQIAAGVVVEYCLAIISWITLRWGQTDLVALAYSLALIGRRPQAATSAVVVFRFVA